MNESGLVCVVYNILEAIDLVSCRFSVYSNISVDKSIFHFLFVSCFSSDEKKKSEREFNHFMYRIIISSRMACVARYKVATKFRATIFRLKSIEQKMNFFNQKSTALGAALFTVSRVCWYSDNLFFFVWEGKSSSLSRHSRTFSFITDKSIKQHVSLSSGLLPKFKSKCAYSRCVYKNINNSFQQTIRFSNEFQRSFFCFFSISFTT